MTQTYTATTTVSSDMIADQVIAAVEGGINYWCGTFHLATPDRSTLEHKPWYADPKLYEQDFVIKVTLSDGPHDKSGKTEYEITPDSIRKALTLMAESHKGHLADMLQEEGDADTADVFVQLCAFSEVVYG